MDADAWITVEAISGRGTAALSEDLASVVLNLKFRKGGGPPPSKSWI